jgi:hypothetical protein
VSTSTSLLASILVTGTCRTKNTNNYSPTAECVNALGGQIILSQPFTSSSSSSNINGKSHEVDYLMSDNITVHTAVRCDVIREK